MTEPDDQNRPHSDELDGPVHPRLEMEGPRVGELGHRRLPEMGALPYAGGSTEPGEVRSRLLPVLVAAGGVVVASSVVWAATSDGGTPIAAEDPRTDPRPPDLVADLDDREAETDPEADVDEQGTGSDEETSSAAAATDEPDDVSGADSPSTPTEPPSTTEAPTTTTEAPSTTTAPAPSAEAPAPAPSPDGGDADADAEAGVELASPEAWFVDGDLVLVGAVPDQRIADALTRKAAGIVGEDGVVDGFRIDARADVPVGLPVVVSERVEFALESSEVDARFLDLVGEWKTILDAYPGVTMSIVGHTDSTGPLDYNEWLSEQRAEAVAGWMQERGIAADRFEVEGVGPADPIDDNDTAEGRARNRRIQVTLDGMLMV